MSGRLAHELEYHYPDGTFEMVHTRILRSAIKEKRIDSLNIVSLILQNSVTPVTEPGDQSDEGVNGNGVIEGSLTIQILEFHLGSV